MIYMIVTVRESKNLKILWMSFMDGPLPLFLSPLLFLLNDLLKMPRSGKSGFRITLLRPCGLLCALPPSLPSLPFSPIFLPVAFDVYLALYFSRRRRRRTEWEEGEEKTLVTSAPSSC